MKASRQLCGVQGTHVRVRVELESFTYIGDMYLTKDTRFSAYLNDTSAKFIVLTNYVAIAKDPVHEERVKKFLPKNVDNTEPAILQLSLCQSIVILEELQSSAKEESLPEPTGEMTLLTEQ